MDYEITLEPSGRTLRVRADQNLVAAALEQGVAIHHGCGNGSCGDCKGTVLAGEYEQLPFMPLLLTPQERSAGKAILCKLQPRSDMRIEAQIDTPDHWQGKIHALSRLAPSVMEIRLQLEREYPYRAGQYARIAVPGQAETWRSYSLACPPGDDHELVFHVRAAPGGLFTEWLFHQAQLGDILQLSAAQGDFYLREDNDRPLLCIAAGTGLAPIEAVLQQAFQSGWQRPMTLFFGARKRQDFYHLELLSNWAQRYPNFQFIPTLSDKDDESWTGARRLLPSVAQMSHWQGHEAYLCGSPGMVEAAIDLLLSHGLPSGQIHFDSFAPNG